MTEELKKFCLESNESFRNELFDSRTINGVRGIYASQDIESGTVLFKHQANLIEMPEPPYLSFASSVFSYSSILIMAKVHLDYIANKSIVAAKIKALEEFGTLYRENVSQFIGTAFTLMIERLCYKKTNYSPFGAYLSWLPERSEGLVLMSDEDLQQIRGSSLYFKIMEFKSASYEGFKELFHDKHLPELINFFNLVDVELNFDSFWKLFNESASIVQAYSFTLHLEDTESYRNYLVPMMDAFNADENLNNVKLMQSVSDGWISLEAITTKDIRQHEQIFNTFGNDMTQSQRLIKYGYIDATDVVSLTIDEITIVDVDSEIEDLLQSSNEFKQQFRSKLEHRRVIVANILQNEKILIPEIKLNLENEFKLASRLISILNFVIQK